MFKIYEGIVTIGSDFSHPPCIFDPAFVDQRSGFDFMRLTDEMMEVIIRHVLPAVLLGTGVLLAACETQPPPPEEPIPGEQQLMEPQTFDYECPDGFVFQVAMQEQSIELILPDTTITLARVDAPSGARYVADGYEYWSRDAEAVLQVPGEERHGCIPDRATPAW